MYKIWKQGFDITHEQVVKLPSWRGRYVNNLSFQLQNGVPTLWFLFDDKEPLEFEDTVIRCYGTGEPINEEYPGSYIGTVQKDGFVWHFFEKASLSPRLDVAEDDEYQGP